jgi:integrase/recombinase XerC
MSARLAVVEGGREGGERPVCRVCGTPGPADCAVLRRHLDWLRARGLSPNTITTRRRGVWRLAVALGGVPVLEATPADLERWRDGLDRLTPAVIGQYVSHAQQFYRWAAGAGYITADPSAGLPFPRPPRRLPRPISERDLMAALDEAPTRIRPWLTLAAWCGLRAQEIAFLRWDSVLDSTDPPVLIVTAEAAKGGRERIVPLNPFVIAELRAVPRRSSGYVFQRYDGRPGANQPHLISQLCGQHMRRVGIHATLHQLRHRFGTQCYRTSGRDLRAVQELLGHASVNTTQLYTAYDRENAQRAVRALPVPGPDGGPQ